MKIIKKLSSLATLLMIVATFPLHSMGGSLKAMQLAPWTLAVGDVLLGKKSIQQFQNLTKSDTSFTSLPESKNIIELLQEFSGTDDFSTAGVAIDVLIQINQQLDQLINQPEFSLQLIKFLSQQFNIDNETVCLYLKTKGTQKLLRIQTKLKDMCGKHNLKDFMDIYQEGADPNFTYKNGMTLLLFCVRDNEILFLRFLLKKGANPNLFYQQNRTPLTASVTFDRPQAAESLLEFGADPELADGMGITPLSGANSSKDNKISELLKQAIKDKKLKQKK